MHKAKEKQYQRIIGILSVALAVTLGALFYTANTATTELQGYYRPSNFELEPVACDADLCDIYELLEDLHDQLMPTTWNFDTMIQEMNETVRDVNKTIRDTH